MEALMPGSTGKAGVKPPPQRQAISIKGLTPGRRLRPRRMLPPGARATASSACAAKATGIEVHTIGCDQLADGVDADWVDLAWGDESDGGTARLCVVIKNEPGALAVIAGIFGSHGANIVSMDQTRATAASTPSMVDIEVHDVQHLMRILAALRAADVVSTAERL